MVPKLVHGRNGLVDYIIIMTMRQNTAECVVTLFLSLSFGLADFYFSINEFSCFLPRHIKACNSPLITSL